MRLIDSHCHLTHERLAGTGAGAQILSRARQAGVVAFVCASGHLSEAVAARALACQNADVFFTVGVHPHEAKNFRPEHLGQLEQLASDAKCVAIGEIGLDYHYDFSPRDAQRLAFEQLLALAGRLGHDKKVVIHSREALDDTLAIIAASGISGQRLVFHSCTESPENIGKILDLGAMIGFAGIVTFKNAPDLRRQASVMPVERMLIETDSPYLSPEPVRSMKTNEPANVAHIAKCLADARGIAVEALAEQTTQNAQQFFRLDIRQ
jgi:TatD DNase family protein